LFAEIQAKAVSSQSSFTHVEKNAHKKDPSSAPEIPQPKPKAAPKAPVEEVKRPPKKALQGNTWYVENYGKEVLRFEGEEDVQQNYGWALIKCQDTTVVVEGKFKTMMLENCSNIKVIITSVLGNVELINCKKITITIKEQCPTFNIERSNGVHLYLFPPAKGCKVHSTCSQAMVVHYPLKDASEDDEWLDIAIPETNITWLKDDKLHTEAAEGME
jgi:Adenylate cyclase associated (CAP) C terminal